MSSASPSGPVYVDWGKLLQIVLIVAATVALSITNKIPPETVTLILGTGAGYIFGNGKSVKEGLPPAPLVGRRPTLGEQVDQEWRDLPTVGPEETLDGSHRRPTLGERVDAQGHEDPAPHDDRATPLDVTIQAVHPASLETLNDPPR